MSDGETVLSELDRGVLRLTLNRPDKLNSFTEEMHLALRAGIERAGEDAAVRAVLLTGAGRFCAGQDNRDPRKGGTVPICARRSIPVQPAAAHDPWARQAGDLRRERGRRRGRGQCRAGLRHRSGGAFGEIIQAFSRIGLVPDAGGSWSLPRMIGEPRAKALTLLAEPLSAAQAEQWGLIWKAVDDEALMDEAMEIAAKLAAGPTIGLGLTKRLIQDAAGQDLDTHLDAERDAQREAGRTADYREGVTAFLEKRKAEFRGE